MKIVVGMLSLLLLYQVQASELSTRYDLKLDLHNLAQRQYPLQMQATITNNSDQELRELVWLFYPNRYQTKLPYINDVNLHRIYPRGFSTGGLNPSKLVVNGVTVDVSTLTPLDLDRYGQTFIQQQLPEALAPGQSVVVQMTAMLEVPHKYGSFGWYRDALTMSGGWSPVLVSCEQGKFHPEYQMPKADWSLLVDTDDGVKVALAENASAQKSLQLKQTRQISLKAGALERFTLQEGPYTFQVYHTERNSKKIKAPLSTVVHNFAHFLGRYNMHQNESFALAQAPLREMLVIDGSPLLYFSDRAFKVPRFLDHFHEIPIYKALFMQLYEQKLTQIEHEKDLFWVQEVVAWRLTDELVRLLQIKHRDARQIGVLQMFRFLPLIDRVLYTPQFAFYDVFYNLVYPKDYVRDEVRRYPGQQPFGQTILAHMEDEFGQEKTLAMIDAYINTLPTEGFRAFAASYMQRDLSKRFAQWVAPRPWINYQLGRHHKKKVGLQFEHTITIEQQSDGHIIEPVALKVTYQDKSFETQKWMSTTPSHTFTFITDQKVKAIEIDPEDRLLESTKSDNRRPSYWKFVVLSMFVEYDFEEKQPLFMILGQIRKRYGGLDRFDIGGYSQFNASGANFGYTRLFGKAIDALRLSHGFRVAMNFNQLVDDNAIVQTIPAASQVLVTDGGFATDVSLAYVFGNQLSYINPLRGAYGGLTLRMSNPLLGSQYKYRMLGFNLAGIVPLHPNHLWGVRFQIGTSGTSEMPTQLQYRLGGLTSIRGLPLTDDRFTGRHILLLTNEYRHFLVQDMDVNLGLFRIRKIQGALYSNVGNTTHTVQEQADVSAGLRSSTTGFVDLFDPRNLKVDVGYGLRLHIHYVGVSPSLIAFDVARSVTEKGFGWLYYLGVNQTF